MREPAELRLEVGRAYAEYLASMMDQGIIDVEAALRGAVRKRGSFFGAEPTHIATNLDRP